MSADEQEEAFAKSVRDLREEKGWTQAELAKMCQERGLGYMNQTTISRIEKGSRPVRLAEAQVLSLLFSRTVWMMLYPESRIEFYSAQATLQQWRSAHGTAEEAIHNLRLAFDDVQRVASKFEETVGKNAEGITDPETRNWVSKQLQALSAIAALRLESVVQFLTRDELEKAGRDGKRQASS